MNTQLINQPASLSIVVPCYNESEIFLYTKEKLLNLLFTLIYQEKINSDSYILFVDDGSKDNTWELIKNANSPFIQGIKLSRNRGHQIALIAGLSIIDTDISITIDADLQDDITCIPKMIDEYYAGNDIVYGIRNDRTTDSFFKRFTANTFYTLMTKFGIEQVENHADFRLLSKRAVRSLLQYTEQNIYLRGLIPLLGYQCAKVYYSRNERIAGESKYPLRKMLSLALEGITSLSIMPLRLVCKHPIIKTTQK